MEREAYKRVARVQEKEVKEEYLVQNAFIADQLLI
jgi:hypothetical protein